MSTRPQGEESPIIIKKYANRRLYNTATSSYVTLDNLSQMVRRGGDFIVYDAKTGEDITRSVLTQIIVEEEQKGQSMLPIGFLRELIGFYGNNMQWMVPRYLEHALKSFSQNKEQLSKNAGSFGGGMFPLGPFEELGKQNMALFEQALKMFTPPMAGGPAPQGEPAAPPPRQAAPDTNANALNELAERLNQLQSQIEALTKGTK